jgi:hypothetical protein
MFVRLNQENILGPCLALFLMHLGAKKYLVAVEFGKPRVSKKNAFSSFL